MRSARLNVFQSATRSRPANTPPVGVGRPELHGYLPQPAALGTGRGARFCLQLFGADLCLDLRVGLEVEVPLRVLGRPAFRGDDNVAAFPGSPKNSGKIYFSP